MKKGAWREERLMAALRANGRVTVGEAVKMLGVSEATARRLFSALEATGQVIRNYGGIQMPSWDGYSFEQYEKVLESEKRRIGIAASALVEQGDSLYLDCGTTLLQMAEALRARIGAGEIGSLNIVTNSIANLGVLADAPLCRVILLGENITTRAGISPVRLQNAAWSSSILRNAFWAVKAFRHRQAFQPIIRAYQA